MTIIKSLRRPPLKGALLAFCSVFILCSAAGQALAYDHRYDHRHYDHHRYYRHPGYGGGYYAPPPVVYQPAYAPPPVVYDPGPAIGLNIHIR
jgi:hypothetical protein